MSTLRTLAERAIRDLSGGDIPNDSPYDIDYVIETVRDAMNEDLKLEILKRRAGDEDDKSSVAQFVATYFDVPVNVEKETARVYAALPDFFISLKYNKGIHSVSEMKKSLKPMIRIHQPGITFHLPHASLEKTTYGYYVEGMKIFWMRDIIQDDIKKVLIKLIIAAPSNITADDVLPLLPDNIGRILDVVKNRIANRFPQDRLADNNPNIRALNEQQK